MDEIPRYNIEAQIERMGADSLLPNAAPKKRPVQREWKAQAADNVFLAKALPPGAYFTAIDHARQMSAIHGKMRKDRGVKPGIADWLIVHAGTTLWIERKAGSSLSENQKLFRDCVVSNGHRWALARSTEDIEAACRDAGIPLRATLGGIRERIAEQNARISPLKKRKSKPRQEKPSAGRIKQVNAVRARVLF